MLYFGVDDGAFKIGTKWLCTMYSRMKPWLKLSGKNTARGYLIYSHKQSHLSCIDILTLKWDILKRKIKESNP